MFFDAFFFLSIYLQRQRSCERYFQILLQNNLKREQNNGKDKAVFLLAMEFFLKDANLKTSPWGAPLSLPHQKRLFKFKAFFKKNIMRFGTTLTKKIKKLKPQKNGIFEFFCFFYWKIVKRIIASSSWEPKFCFHEEGQLFSLFGYQDDFDLKKWKKSNF